MRVVVLGGSGFLGLHVIEKLSKEGYEVINISRRARSTPNEIACDLFSDDAPLSSLLEGADACIHLAGDLVPGSAEIAGWNGYLRNLQLAHRVADVCIATGVRKLVYASSGGTIYGGDVLNASEDMGCKPIGFYGAQKLAAETLLRSRLIRSNCRLTILRIGNPFGPGQESKYAHGVIGRIFNCMLNGEEFTIWGDGTQVRDYIFVKDVAGAFYKALGYDGAYDLFNIGSSEAVSTDDLVALCAEISGLQLECTYRPKAIHEVERISLNIHAAERQLGWRPSMNLKQGLYIYYRQLLESK
jgi:UDP-glucose 4-epimerase